MAEEIIIHTASPRDITLEEAEEIATAVRGLNLNCAVKEAEGFVSGGLNVRGLRVWNRPSKALVRCSSETGSDHLHVIAEEVSRVAELCMGWTWAS